MMTGSVMKDVSSWFDVNGSTFVTWLTPSSMGGVTAADELKERQPVKKIKTMIWMPIDRFKNNYVRR